MTIIPIVFQRFPFYVKKKDLDSYIEKQKKQIKVVYGMVFLTIVLIQLFFVFIVLPKIVEIYTDVGLTMPSYSVILIIVSIFLGAVAWIIIFSLPPLSKEKIDNLKKQKDDMITINSRLVNSKIDLVGGIYVFISVVVIIFAIIFPVYTLTSSI